MKVLHNILQVQYGDRPAGHWVVMNTVVSDIPVFVLAYAQSQRGVSYMISICESTEVQDKKYLSHFEDDFGNVTYKELNRPHICHFIYEFVPLIDEHNKQRQNLLNMKMKWCTKDCWLRLLATLVRIIVVDFHSWYRNVKTRNGRGTLQGAPIQLQALSIIMN